MTQPHQITESTRRNFVRSTGVIAASMTLGVTASGVGSAQQPAFNEQIYGDGVAWGTKGVTTLPPPTDDNKQSFDPLIFIVDETRQAPGILQLPVSEAAPRNPEYNGGRWISKLIDVSDLDMGTTLPIKDYDDFSQTEISKFQDGAPLDGNSNKFRPDYFECPLLPVKD